MSYKKRCTFASFTNWRSKRRTVQKPRHAAIELPARKSSRAPHSRNRSDWSPMERRVLGGSALDSRLSPVRDNLRRHSPWSSKGEAVGRGKKEQRGSGRVAYTESRIPGERERVSSGYVMGSRQESRRQGCVTRRLRSVTKIFKNMYLSGRTGWRVQFSSGASEPRRRSPQGPRLSPLYLFRISFLPGRTCVALRRCYTATCTPGRCSSGAHNTRNPRAQAVHVAALALPLPFAERSSISLPPA